MAEIATVIVDELNIHNRPGDGRGVIGSVPKNTKLVVIKHHPGLKADWVQVERPVALTRRSLEYWAAVRTFATGVRYLTITHTPDPLPEPPPAPPTIIVAHDEDEDLPWLMVHAGKLTIVGACIAAVIVIALLWRAMGLP